MIVIYDISTIRKQIDNLSDEKKSRAESLFRTISVRLMGELSSNSSFRKIIEGWNESGHAIKKMSDASEYVGGLIGYATDQMNKKILRSIRSDVKKNREKEKNLVLKFFTSNKNELKKLFDLNTALGIK